MAANSWQSIAAMYLRKGSMMVGIGTFQPAHAEIDLAVGQVVQICCVVVPWDTSSPSDMTSKSSSSIGGTSSGSSV